MMPIPGLSVSSIVAAGRQVKTSSQLERTCRRVGYRTLFAIRIGRRAHLGEERWFGMSSTRRAAVREAWPSPPGRKWHIDT